MPERDTLDRYARLVVEVGLNLQPGQRLLVGGFRAGVALEAADFVRELVTAAYARGAAHVGVLWEDRAVRRVRLEHEPDDRHLYGFERSGGDDIEAGCDAHLGIVTPDPTLYGGLPAARIAAAEHHWLTTHERSVGLRMGWQVNWSIVAYPTAAWARAVFGERGDALERLWEAVLRCVRIDQADPVEAWRRHVAELVARGEWLTGQALDRVRFRGPGTHLELGLPAGHRWTAGQVTTGGGVPFVPNMPTDEVFTMPHRERADGVVRLTRPVELNGSLVDGAELELRGGSVVRATARTGEEALRSVLETDEGARRLGEVALVPASAPAGRAAVLFHDVLFDENASCHIALGRSYPGNLPGSDPSDEGAYAARGANLSLEHRDLMIGSADLDVDGARADGSTVALLRDGEWAFPA